MTDKLSLYNGALAILGERKLANLTENREPRHKLDDIWDRDFVKRVLQRGQWNFATRSIQPAASASVTPAFGYTNAFEKPDDFIRTTGVCQDEYFEVPLTRYTDETGYWWADLDTIYVRYVSNDSQYGGDFSLWPPNFTIYAEHELAAQVAPRLSGYDRDRVRELKQLAKEALDEAKNTDAMEEAANFQPEGSWVRARRGARGGDRGNRGSLIG